MECHRGAARSLAALCTAAAVWAGLVPVAEAQRGGRRDRGPRAEHGPSRQSPDQRAPDSTREAGKPSSVAGAVVIHPVTIGPSVRMGSVTIGEPVTAGRDIVVGHPHDARRSPDPSPFFNAPFDTGAPVPDASRVERRRGSRMAPALVFVPWYPVGSRLMAGVPVRRADRPADEPSEEVAATDAPGVAPADADGPASAAVRETAPGGLTLELSPPGAGVYLDDSFVGHASDFLPSRAVLSLPPGLHTVELRAEGYASERFDVLATSGQVIPLAGSLTPLAPVK